MKLEELKHTPPLADPSYFSLSLQLGLLLMLNWTSQTQFYI